MVYHSLTTSLNYLGNKALSLEPGAFLKGNLLENLCGGTWIEEEARKPATANATRLARTITTLGEW